MKPIFESIKSAKHPGSELNFPQLSAKNIASAIEEFYSQCGAGFYFSGSLHFFGDEPGRPFHDITYRTHLLLEKFQGIINPSAVPFAEDIFGNHFLLTSQDVSFFFIESGEEEKLADSFISFLNILLEDYNYLSGESLMLDWEKVNGTLPIGHRLIPKKFFLTGGEYVASNLYNMEFEKVISLNAEIARQTFGLADGQKIKITIKGEIGSDDEKKNI